MGLSYIATPYSHPDRAVVVSRFDAVNKVAAILMNSGFFIFSPISHSHPIAEAGELPTSWDYWEKSDRLMLSKCSEMIVLKIDGWDISRGVNAEIEIAKELGIPIRFVNENGEFMAEESVVSA